MRWYGCGHTYGDTVGSVDQQIRKTGRQNYRLLFFSVKVRSEIYRIFFNISEHLQSQRSHTGFCITHGCGAISVNGTEVSVAVYESVSYVERLSQPYHCVIYGGVSVRVVFTHDFSDYTGGFFVRLVRSYSQSAHTVKDPSVYRL